MKNVKKQLVTYFAYLGLSFIIGWLGFMKQPVAFFWSQILGLLIITLREAYKKRADLVETLGAILVVLFVAAVGMIPSALIAWVFHLNFFVVFEVVAFICIFLFNGNKRKSKTIKFG